MEADKVVHTHSVSISVILFEVVLDLCITFRHVSIN